MLIKSVPTSKNGTVKCTTHNHRSKAVRMLACRVGASRSPHEVLINGFPRREEVLAYLAGFPNTKWNTKVHDNHPTLYVPGACAAC